eukprot:3862716-Rhodomonas_salina.2
MGSCLCTTAAPYRGPAYQHTVAQCRAWPSTVPVYPKLSTRYPSYRTFLAQYRTLPRRIGSVPDIA